MKSYQNVGEEPLIQYYRDRDAKEIDVVIEGDGKLCPLEKRQLHRISEFQKTFKLIDKSPLRVGTSAVLCMADKLSAFDSNNLIVPIWLI